MASNFRLNQLNMSDIFAKLELSCEEKEQAKKDMAKYA